jgi:microcystin-dependent protein
MAGIPTPSALPEQWDLVRLLVPHEQAWYAAFLGALEGLGQASLFKSYSGVSETCAASIFSPLFEQALDETEGYMFVGMMTPSGRANPPDNWLACDGTAYLITQYPNLYNAIGTTFGDDGAGTFRVPDMRLRFPVGADGTTGYNPGDTGGEAEHTLSVNEIPAHHHDLDFILLTGTTTGIPLTGQPQGDYGDISTKNTGGGLAHNNIPPYLALNWFIFAGWSCA